MKKDWILWNVLQKPEKITADERMEQIEWKSYYWCYKAMQLVLWISLCFWPFFRSMLWQRGSANPEPGSWNILILTVLVSIESGRFLYNCYHGNQEFYDRNRGRTNFLSLGILTGFLTCSIFWLACGIRHPLPWVMFLAGTLFYWGLCHLAYLHYALISDEAAEERGRKWEAWIPGVCGGLLALYFLFLGVFSSRTIFLADELLNASLEETEQAWLREIEQGKESYEYLESCKIEYRFQTTPETEDPVNEYGDMAHAIHWMTEDRMYTQILNPDNNDAVYEEYYCDKGESWNKAIEGRWVCEDDWRENSLRQGAEAEEWWSYYPYTGIPPINPKAVISIQKERQGQEVSYTVSYTEAYVPYGTTLHDRTDAENISVTVRYILNNYGVLTGYECSETADSAKTGELLNNTRSFYVLNVNSAENQEETESLINQYRH